MSDEARRAKTLVEREEEYRLARERIFGAEGAASTSVEAGGDRGGCRSEEGRSGGPGEGGTGSGSGSGRGSGRSSPIVLDSLGVVPSQVRRSEQPGSGSGLGKGKESGVVRQPRGPGEGGGFRR